MTNKTKKTENWNHYWLAFKNGDMDAFHRIYVAFFDKLYAYGSKLTKDNTVLEDCIQELFLTLYTNRSKLAIDINLEYYLVKSLRLTIYQKFRKLGKIEFFGLSQVLDEESDFIFELETEQSATEEHRQEIIKNILNTLDAGYREILYLKFYSNLSYEEIGEILSIHPDSAKKKIYRIIHRLRKKYTGEILELFIMCFTA